MFTLLDEASVESGGAAGLDGSRQAEQAVTDREHAGHTRDLALAELLYGSGLRISEALDLDVTMWTRQAVSSGSWARVPRNASRH